MRKLVLLFLFVAVAHAAYVPVTIELNRGEKPIKRVWTHGNSGY